VRESVERFIDDPVKVMAPITLGAAALFAVFAEASPEHRELTYGLGAADFVFNTACWIKFARDKNQPQQTEALANELFIDETA